MRWFRGSAEKTYRTKLRPRKSPTVPKSPSPKTKPLTHKQRSPKLDQPVVDMPFADPGRRPKTPTSSLDRKAVSATDNSRGVLEAMKTQIPEGAITRIVWQDPTPSNDDGGICAGLDNQTWGSIDSFLNDPEMDPDGVAKGAGIMARSHAGCDCYLLVYTNNDSVYKVGIDSSDYAPDNLFHGPGHEEEGEGEEGEEEG